MFFGPLAILEFTDIIMDLAKMDATLLEEKTAAYQA
jgi:hypothetical protein